MTTRSLARRIAAVEQRLQGSGDALGWATHQEEQVLAGLGAETAISAEVRQLAERALYLVAAERRASGCVPPQQAGGPPPVPPEVLELMERARRELELEADWGWLDGREPNL